MKINNKKIIVSTLALAMGAAMAGSISGSVAWYQYSTRATAQMSGTSAGTSRSLKIATSDLAKNSGDWKYNVEQGSKDSLRPSAPVIDANGVVTGFKEHPVYQYFNTWNNADNGDYFSYSLFFQSLDKDGNREALPIYLTAYNLNTSADNTIKEALRVQLVTYNYDGSEWQRGNIFNLSNTTQTTVVSDYLDLNNNGVVDTNGFAADDSQGVGTKYSASGATDQYTTVTFDSILANDDDPYAFSGGTSLASTSITANVRIDVKVWLEGWQKLSTAGSKQLSEGANTLGYYSDSACTEAAPANHSVGAKSEGTPGAGLYTDEACNTPAAVDGNGNLTADGSYYAKGADGSSTYYFNNYIWDNATIGTTFNIDLRFAVQANK